MDVLFPALHWGGPIGLGFLLMAIGVLLWGCSKVIKATAAAEKEPKTNA